MVLAVSSAAFSNFNSRAYKVTPVTYQHPQVSSSGDVPVLRQTSDIQADGHYSYQYELGNGVSASESGVGGQSVQGNYQYVSPEGEPIAITYTADENGYQAHGSHVPEIPSYILKSLEYIRTHAPYDETKHAVASRKSYTAAPVATVHRAPTAFKTAQAKVYRAPVKTAYRATVKPVYKTQFKSNTFNKNRRF